MTTKAMIGLCVNCENVCVLRFYISVHVIVISEKLKNKSSVFLSCKVFTF